ncbi:MAG: hypothetical protein JKY02_06010 [Flavobacteriaceae bacterium]|nr:hypothetical protein [Flavobacteriaceae bacterium]
MSFISAMATSLKNNKRDRKNALEILKENGGYSTKTELRFDKKATKNQLKNIREKIKKENRTRLRNKTLLILSIILILIYFVGFVNL